MMLRTELCADQRLDTPGDVALAGRRAVGTEQVLAQIPCGKRPSALAAGDVFRHALADDGACRFPSLGAVAVERLLQIGSQSEGFGHGLSSAIQTFRSVSRLLPSSQMSAARRFRPPRSKRRPLQ